MKIESYCYTRGEQPDYRDFCLPSNVGKNIVSILRNMVAPILESGLDTPRWVMYKCHDVIAWGICCKNELLSSSFNTDIKGRSVKGFFSIICSDIDDRNICIPSFDISFFENSMIKKLHHIGIVRKVILILARHIQLTTMLRTIFMRNKMSIPPY